jgi:hypothetical protein
VIQGALKLIKCVKPEPSGHVCGRWLADFPVNKAQEQHTICPACHTSWHISQNEAGLITFQEIKKTGKEYDDDGLRVIIR